MSSFVHFVERSANPLLQITMHHNCAGHCRGDRHEVPLVDASKMA